MAETKSKKATVITYTDNELAAIATLQSNRGEHLSAKELGIANAVLTSLIKKAADERPMAEGLDRVVVNKEKVEDVCPTCGAKRSYNVYWID